MTVTMCLSPLMARGPVRDQRAGEAVRDEELRCRLKRDGAVEGGDPVVAVGVVPVALGDPDEARLRPFPMRLPVLGAGAAEAGKDQDRRHVRPPRA